MCLTEYNETETMQLFKEEWFEEGRKEGREEGVFETLFDLVNEGIITPEFAASRLHLTLDDFYSQLDQYNQDK